MVLKLSKKVHFLHFYADLSKKAKYVNAIYIYGSESSCYTLSEHDRWFIVVSAIIHEILALKISKKMLTQQKFNKILRLQTLVSPKH